MNLDRWENQSTFGTKILDLPNGLRYHGPGRRPMLSR
jgi:hypothetical protein